MAEESSGIGGGLAGMLNVFVDPGTTAKHAAKKGFWLWPVLTLIIGYLVIGFMMKPFYLEMAKAQMAQNPNIPPERVEAMGNMGGIIATVQIVVTPLVVIGIVALMALLVNVMLSMLGTPGRFQNTFGLMAASGLISLLQFVAIYVVLRMKGDPVTSREQFMAGFGLDIFLPGLHGVPLAIANFFSIFELWYLVVLTFGLSALYKVSKGKAFAAATPAWLIPLLFAIVGGLFSKAPGN